MRIHLLVTASSRKCKEISSQREDVTTVRSTATTHHHTVESIQYKLKIAMDINAKKYINTDLGLSLFMSL